MKTIAKNISYTFVSNIVGLFVSTILIIIVPRYVTVENYGFWQLYIFYSSYTSYLSFGLTDGVYLRLAGKKYSSINVGILKSQTLILFFFNFLIAVLYGITTNFFLGVSIKRSILFLSLISSIIIVPRSLFTFVLQATNRIKEYAIVILLERTLYFFLILMVLIRRENNFYHLIFSDILAKALTYIYIYIICNEIFWSKCSDIKSSVKESINNISVGSKLLLANLSSMLIIGVLRFSIEKIWDITTFGKVSLTLSISNMLMIFINSVGIVLLPIVKNLKEERIGSVYLNLRLLLTSTLFILMICYFPLSEVIKAILPKYADSIKYVALLFPMCIFEGKMAMLINTYMKALRLEDKLMKYNILSVLLSLLLSLFFGFFLNNLNLTVLSIVLALIFKCTLSESYLTKRMNIQIHLYMSLDIILTGIFIIVAWYLPVLYGFASYFSVILIYLISLNRKIKSSYKYFKEV